MMGNSWGHALTNFGRTVAGIARVIAALAVFVAFEFLLGPSTRLIFYFVLPSIIRCASAAVVTEICQDRVRHSRQ